MRWCDTHCHLDAMGGEDVGLEAQLQEARAAGVGAIVLPAVAPENWARCVEIAAAHEEVKLALGIHPQAVRELSDAMIDEALARLPGLLRAHGAVAVGELGLDWRWDRDEVQRARQLRVFEAQLEIALEVGLAPIIHCLDAQEVLLRSWRGHPCRGKLEGVMHSYSGSADMVPLYVREGMWMSYSGSVTWHNAKRTPRAASATPLSRLLVETDAPYQPPHPLQARQNHPARVVEVGQCVARLQDRPVEEVARETWANACAAFGLG